MRFSFLALLCGMIAAHPLSLSAQQHGGQSTSCSSLAEHEYRLGAGDEVSVRVLDLEPLNAGVTFAVEQNGAISLPIAGHVQAAGQTIPEFENTVAQSLRPILRTPVVNVNITKYGSQPVSVWGAVTTPGTIQVEGHKSLLEVLSQAGGLRAEAGSVIRITRHREYGVIPVDGSHTDGDSRYYQAEIPVSPLLMARAPQNNICMMPNDVVSVPFAEVVYVLGAVQKPGVVPLGDKTALTVLQALAHAEGPGNGAALKKARIIRRDDNQKIIGDQMIDLRQLLKGRQEDIVLQSNSILFVPSQSGLRAAASRAVDIAASAGSMGLALR